MSPTGIERELHESNGIDRNKLALPPGILTARSTLDDVDHGPTTHSAMRQTQHLRYILQRPALLPQRLHRNEKNQRCFNCHELTHPTCSCSCKPRSVQCTSTERILAEHPKHECEECRKVTKWPPNNLKCVNCNGNLARNEPGCPSGSGLLKDVGPMQRMQSPGDTTDARST